MRVLFVDTAGWVACADSADPAHRRSCEARDSALEAGQTLVTTDFVADETLTLVRIRLGPKRCRTVVATSRQKPSASMGAYRQRPLRATVAQAVTDIHFTVPVESGARIDVALTVRPSRSGVARIFLAGPDAPDAGRNVGVGIERGDGLPR
jgi:hypothetical protein